MTKSQKEVEGVFYKFIELLIEVTLPSGVPRLVVRASIHLQSLLECIRPSTTEVKSPLSLYANHNFVGEHKMYRELIFRFHCYMNCASTRRLEKLEIRPLYVRELEYIHSKEVSLQKLCYTKEIDQVLIEASLNLSMATIFRRHYSSTANLLMMEAKVLPLLDKVEKARAANLGRSHPLTLQSVNAMALIYRKMKKVRLEEEQSDK